jgi:adenylate cyclase
MRRIINRILRLIITPQHPLRRLEAGLAIGAGVGAIMALGLYLGLFSSIRTQQQDRLYKPRATQGRIVIIAIDDMSLGVYGRSTVDWDRSVHAELIRFLDDAGARVITFDVLFADPGDPAVDRALAATMDESCRVIQPVAGVNRRTATTQAGKLITFDLFVHPIPVLQNTCADRYRPGLGHSNVIPDGDGAVRRVPLVVGRSDAARSGQGLVAYMARLRAQVDPQADAPIPALGLAAFLDFQGLDMSFVDIQPDGLRFGYEGEPIAGLPALPTDDFGRMLIYYFGPPSHVNDPDSTFPVYSFVDVAQGRVPPEVFADTIVLVGALDATALPDNYPTPSTDTGEKMYGVEIHANILETILQSQPQSLRRFDKTVDLGFTEVTLLAGREDFPLREQPLSGQLLVTFGLALVAGGLLPFLRWYVGPLLIALLYGAYFFWASISFDLWGEVFELVFPAASLLFTYIGVMIAIYLFEERRRSQINDLFSRYVSSEIAQKIVEAFDRGQLELGGEEREITVLFADVRGFTPLAEGLPPHEVVHLLNLFLEEMNMIVMRYGGAINKYIGDNLMAFWNAPYPQEDHAWLATQAGLDMLAAIQRLNAQGQITTPVQFGIGINTGPVVVGNIGSQRRLEYTPIGDTVNVASRLSGVAAGDSCFLGPRTYELIADRVQPEAIHHLTLKGKAAPLTIYDLRLDSDATPDIMPPGE